MKSSCVTKWGPQSPARPPRCLSHSLSPSFSAGFLGLSASLLLILALAFPVSAQSLRIYHIDVEQGDATLFVAPNGKTLLVDSGRNGDGRRIKAVMDRAGVTQIDFFVATHYHSDHYGGIDDLVEDFGVHVLEPFDRGDKTFLPGSKLTEPTYVDYQRAVGEDARQLKRDTTIPLDSAMTVTCISSGGAVIGESNPTTGADENDMSVSLLITLGTFRYFIGGDIEQTTEAKIAERDLVLDVDIYQANHHGSDTSSLPAFMTDMKPRVIIISNGNRADYRHPRQSTLTFYATLPGPPTVFQTNKYLKGGNGGNVPDAFIADPETTDDDGTILVTVDTAGGSYKVTYGTNSEHTFSVKATTGASVVIESLLPNPAGDDTQLEEVTMRNKGGNAVSLSGWKLQDRSGQAWSLTNLGTLAPGQSKTIRRNGMAMSLNNSGDEVKLLDAADIVKDSFSYTSSTEGTAIQTGH